MSDLESIALDGLHERHPGLTPALAQSYVEAATVCLARHHQSPIVFSIDHGGNGHRRRVNFPAPDERTRKAYANEIDATETGAYGVSLAVVESIVGMVAVKRAETLTGADRYIAPGGDMVEDLESCVRLEVSGINAGSSSDVNRRLREKIAQAASGRSNLPAIAIVVGFRVLEVAVSPLGAQA
jgi:hypothetical protein